jgi:hypothetical protein
MASLIDTATTAIGKIVTNGKNAITGALLNDALNSIFNGAFAEENTWTKVITSDTEVGLSISGGSNISVNPDAVVLAAKGILLNGYVLPMDSATTLGTSTNEWSEIYATSIYYTNLSGQNVIAKTIIPLDTTSNLGNGSNAWNYLYCKTIDSTVNGVANKLTIKDLYNEIILDSGNGIKVCTPTGVTFEQSNSSFVVANVNSFLISGNNTSITTGTTLITSSTTSINSNNQIDLTSGSNYIKVGKIDSLSDQVYIYAVDDLMLTSENNNIDIASGNQMYIDAVDDIVITANAALYLNSEDNVVINCGNIANITSELETIIKSNTDGVYLYSADSYDINLISGCWVCCEGLGYRGGFTDDVYMTAPEIYIGKKYISYPSAEKILIGTDTYNFRYSTGEDETNLSINAGDSHIYLDGNSDYNGTMYVHAGDIFIGITNGTYINVSDSDNNIIINGHDDIFIQCDYKTTIKSDYINIGDTEARLHIDQDDCGTIIAMCTYDGSDDAAYAELGTCSSNYISFHNYNANLYNTKGIITLGEYTSNSLLVTTYFKVDVPNGTLTLSAVKSITASKAITTSSDIRYKNILNDITLSVEDIANAPFFEFSYKDSEDVTFVGTSAQYWQDVCPKAVVETEGKLSLNYSGLALGAATTVAKEVVELKKENETLKTELETLKAELNELKNIINNLK